MIEYTFFEPNYGPEDYKYYLKEDLNRMGESGWEYADRIEGVGFLMKRIKPAPSTFRGY